MESTNPKSKTFEKKIPENSQKQNLNLLCTEHLAKSTQLSDVWAYWSLLTNTTPLIWGTCAPRNFGVGGEGFPGTNSLRILKDNCITHLFKTQWGRVPLHLILHIQQRKAQNIKELGNCDLISQTYNAKGKHYNMKLSKISLCKTSKLQTGWPFPGKNSPLI